MRATVAVLLLACGAGGAAAADIGGYMDQKARSESLLIDDCAEVPALAARTPRDAAQAARLYFAAGVCYLESPKLPRDTLAATLWLRRSADLGYEPARRLLAALPPLPLGAAP